MAKQLNVNLAFTADTREAKAQLQSLQQDLTKLTQTVGNKSPLGITKDISSAIGEVNKLQAALKKATTDSGKLDLNQFRKELNVANLDAKKIADSLRNLGPEGQAAFAKLAQSVTLAELPIKKVNSTLQEFATTLKNTARWQLSSTILHGFMGALQGAYGYAQDLNKSLNSIRVVTGQSAEQMAEFAKQANESAKALSATTTAYTDASLIFFQQGLTGDAVTERTDAVIKMSNVTGDSVEDVASYMTAIWNNFDEGSESLEHYADVITALGAATASSSAEISAGLEKFASIADTVGLSYEYATSALATVVATTRQSADTVGTAFKTLFARIQGLKLGETLDDGVTLNKYSEALNAVGVQVLDTSGQMRALDDILDDLAGKWKMLSSAQQTALAQTVAGTRQYNQLVALMSNWDFMEENLKTARDAEGSLQEQADIYAESWEAASKRVKAAWQEIYTQLLDDKFFINLTNGFGKILDQTSKLIDTLGGLKGIVPLLTTLFLKMFGGDIATSLGNFTQNLQILYGNLDKLIEKRKSFNDELVSLKIDSAEGANPQLGALYQMQGSAQNNLIEQTLRLKSMGRELTDQEQEKLKIILDQNNALTQQYEKQYQILQTKQQERSKAENDAIINSDYTVFQGKNGGQSYLSEEGFLNDLEKATNNQVIIDRYRQLASEIQNAFREGFETNDVKDLLAPLIEQIELTSDEITNVSPKVQNLRDNFQNIIDNPTQENVANFVLHIRELSQEGTKGVPTLDKLINKINGTGQSAKQTESYLKSLIKSIKEENTALIDSNKSYNVAANGVQNFEEVIASLQGSMITLPEAIVTGTRAISTYAMALSSINGLIDSWSDSNRSLTDNLISTATTLGMLVPMFASAGKGLQKIVQGYYAWASASAVKQSADKAEVAWGAIKKLTYTEEAKQIAGLITEEQLQAVAKGNLTKADVIKQVAEENGIKIDRRYFTETSKLTQATFAQAEANQVAAKAQEETNLALLASPIGITLVALAALIAATVAFIKIKEKQLELQREENQAEIERVNKLQEEADANGKLVDSYLKTYNAYKESGEGKEQLANITDQLLEKYGLEGVALAKLTGNYDALTESIKKARQAELDRLITETEKEVNTSGADAFANAKQSRKWDESLWLTNSSIYLNSSDSAQYDFALDTVRNHVHNINESGTTLNIGSDPTEILQTYNEVKQAVESLEAVYTSADLQFSGSYQRMKEWLKSMKDSVEEYQTSLDQLSSYKVENAFLDFNLTKNTSVDELRKNIELVKNDLGNSIDNLDEYIDKYLSGIEDISSAYQKYKLADKIAEATGESVEKALNIINNYNDAQVAFLTLHLNTAILDNDLKDWMDEHSDLIGQLGEQGSKFSLKSAMETLISGGTLSEDTISDLFGNEITSGFIGISQESFNSLDASEQLQTLTNAWIEVTHAVVDGKPDIISSLQEEQKAYAEATDVYIDNINNIKQIIKDFTDQGGQFGYSIEQVEEALIALDKAGSFENLEKNAPEMLDIIKAFNRAAGESETSSYARVIANHIASTKDSANAYKDLEGMIREVSDAELSHAEIVEQVKNVEELQSAAIDDIQKNYQTLKAAVDDYNESGVWSMDNVQALIEMEDKYVAALDLTEEGIVLNTNSLQQMTLAKLDELEASLDLEFQTKMLAIAEKEESYAAMAAAAASAAAGSDFLNMGQNAITAAQGVEILQQTLDKLGNREGGWADLAEQTEKAWEVRKAAIADAREAAKAGGTDFDELMKKSSKSSKRSKGSTDTKDTKNYIKEFDRLYPIKKALEDIADAISDLDKKKSHLVGKSLSEALKKENELLAEQRDLYLDLIKQQSDYRDELAGSLEQFGATFDYSTGNLTNYLEITQAALDKYNAAVDAYNSSHDKGAFSIAEQEYNHFKEVLSAYQSILTDMQETQNNLDDNFLQQIENNLAGFEAEIKVDLDIDEAERKVNDFFKNITTNFKKMYKSTEDWMKIFTTASKNAATYTQGSTSTLETDLKALQEIKDFIDNEGWNSDDPNRLFVSRDDAITKYQELSDQLMEDAQDLYDLYEDTWENYLNAIDEVKSQWDDILKGFDKVDNTLKHYEKIATLLYGGDDTAGGRNYLEQIYNAQQSNSLARQNTLRQQIDAWQKEYDELIAAGADKNDKDLKAIQENIEDSEKNLESEIENYLTIIQNRLTNAIKSIMDTANRSMTKGYGIDTVIERWNDAQEAAEGYYDEVERVYELEAMESKWEEAINKTSSLKNQQYLTSLMNEQLKNLKEKTKLSEYDIGLAERQLAVYQAQVALEEARENKNAMKLVRNEQGNWAYQYVADEEDIANKEEDLRNKTYEEYEYVKNASIEATEKVLELYQTAQERLSALMEEYKYADEARREEIKAEYDYLYEYYYGENGLIVTKAKETQGMEYDLNLAGMKLLWELYEEDEKNYDDMTKVEKTLIDDLRNYGITSYTQLITEVATGDNSLYRQLETVCQEVTNDNRTQWEMLAKGIIGDWATNPDSIRNTISQVYDDIMLKVLEYDIAIETSEQVAGYAWTDIKERTEEAERAVYAVEQAIWSLVSTTDDLSNFAETVRMIGGAFDDIYGRIANAINAAQTFLRLFGQVSDVNIPQVNLPLNPTGKGWTPAIGENGGSGGGPGNNNLSTARDARFVVVGNDTHLGNENIVLYGNNGEGYNLLEMSNIMNQLEADHRQSRVGDYRIVQIGGNDIAGNNAYAEYMKRFENQNIPTANNFANQTLMSSLVQDVQNGMWSAALQAASLNQTVPSSNVINNTTTNDTGNRLSIGTFNAYTETIDEEFMTNSIFDYIGKNNN